MRLLAAPDLKQRGVKVVSGSDQCGQTAQKNHGAKQVELLARQAEDAGTRTVAGTAEFSNGMKQARCQCQQRMAKFKQGNTKENGADAGQEIAEAVEVFAGSGTSIPGAMVDFAAGEEDRRSRGHCDGGEIARQAMAYGGRGTCPGKLVRIPGCKDLHSYPLAEAKEISDVVGAARTKHPIRQNPAHSWQAYPWGDERKCSATSRIIACGRVQRLVDVERHLGFLLDDACFAALCVIRS
ncbi:hypothetical protein [Mesorhizobium sp. ES1-1]|uniref:hypothetical protein n=1 Tax=Mesorhizobium sp. ES1-1 TaxID=2876629 RepID=UPI001CCDBCB6|nr:hypothetical protein [Mesorhizobium sp. ES1-1]MBZ9676198.1 hypothetical protein [Mesorhizobium sp. ES1-1]